MDVNAQMSLTPKQKRVLDFVNRFTIKRGYAPSLQEIADHIGKKLNTPMCAAPFSSTKLSSASILNATMISRFLT